MYVFENPEPNGEVGQVLMMDRNLHVRIEMCVCANVCQCVHLIIVCTHIIYYTSSVYMYM